MPIKSTASRAAMHSESALGSARPMSSTAIRTILRAIYSGSSPASSIRASQYKDASGSLLRTDRSKSVIDWQQVYRPQATLAILKRPPQQDHDLFLGERLQHIDTAARKQRGDNFERRVLGGGPDQANVAFLHMRKKCILLRFVETMNFVDENDSASAVLAASFGVGHDLFDLFDPGKNSAELNEVRARHLGDYLRQRGLAYARRSPKDERTNVITFDLGAKRFSRCDQVLLPNKFVESARTHAIGERTTTIVWLITPGNCLKQTHTTISPRRHGDTEEASHRILLIMPFLSTATLKLISSPTFFPLSRKYVGS